MAVIIRSSKPITIKRRSREHDPAHVGTGWVYIAGFPPDRTKAAYHTIEIEDVRYAFLWNPRGRLGEEWTVGKWSCAPGIMAPHNYMGECSIIYRSPSTPSDDYQLQRKVRR